MGGDAAKQAPSSERTRIDRFGRQHIDQHDRGNRGHERRRQGRETKSAMNTTGSRRRSRPAMSSRTRGAGGLPSCSRMAPSRRQEGRKSCPHSEMPGSCLELRRQECAHRAGEFDRFFTDRESAWPFVALSDRTRRVLASTRRPTGVAQLRLTQIKDLCERRGQTSPHSAVSSAVLACLCSPIVTRGNANIHHPFESGGGAIA